MTCAINIVLSLSNFIGLYICLQLSGARIPYLSPIQWIAILAACFSALYHFFEIKHGQKLSRLVTKQQVGHFLNVDRVFALLCIGFVMLVLKQLGSYDFYVKKLPIALFGFVCMLLSESLAKSSDVWISLASSFNFLNDSEIQMLYAVLHCIWHLCSFWFLGECIRLSLIPQRY